MARQNDHTRAEELISAYLDKRVSAEERDFFERHIASCAACRVQLETTRSMVAALRAMPVVRAPRSFVLPREMARPPRRSFLSLYPALRLATVVAAMAFVVLFAGDLLISRSSGASAPQYLPAAAPAAMQAPEAARKAAPTQEATATETAASAATAPVRSAAPAAGTAAQLSATGAVTEPLEMSVPASTPEATTTLSASQQAQLMLNVTPTPAGRLLDQQALSKAVQPPQASHAEAAPAIDPLRIVEIVLLALVVVLGIATLVVRRKQA